jgi:hypothetical protein
MIASLKAYGFNYVLGKVLLVREYLQDKPVFKVAEGNHRVYAMKQVGMRSVKVLVIAAPDGVYFVSLLIFLYLLTNIFP